MDEVEKSAKVDMMTLSWSRLKQYEECKQSVLRTLQGKRAPVKDGRMFLHGTVADRVMRRLLEHDDPQPGMMLTWVDEIFEEHAYNSAEYVIRWKGNAQEDAAAIKAKVVRVITNLEPILFDKIIPLGYHPELKFNRHTGSVVGVPGLNGIPRPVELIGGIDIATMTLDDDPEYGIYDLKATENDSYARGLTGQLLFYAIATKAMFGKYPKEAAFLTPACKEKVVYLNYSQDDIRLMMSRIVKYCHGVWRKEWEPKEKPDSGCDRCDVRHACDLFRLPQGKKVSFMELADRRRKK